MDWSGNEFPGHSSEAVVRRITDGLPGRCVIAGADLTVLGRSERTIGLLHVGTVLLDARRHNLDRRHQSRRSDFKLGMQCHHAIAYEIVIELTVHGMFVVRSSRRFSLAPDGGSQPL